MASGRIKGITVEIDGSTTGLDKALKGTQTNLSSVQSALKDVNKLLKVDPSNTELLSQKQKLLSQAVDETKKKLEALKSANEQVSKTMGNYDAWKQAYTPIREEIDKTQSKIKTLKEKMTELEKAGKVDTSEYKALGEELQNEESCLKELKQQAKETGDAFGNPISTEQYDALQREIIETEQSLKTLEEQAKKASSVLGTQLQEAGKKISETGNKVSDAGEKLMPATVALAGIGTASVKSAADFESAMSDVAATMGTTVDNITDLKDKAREMGAETSFSATEAAEGLNILAMSGLSAKEQIATIEPVLNLASAGELDLANAASYTTGAIKGFGDSCDNAQYYTDLMAKGATLANTDVQGLGEALSGSAATAKSYGQTADGVTLSLLRLAEQNITGTEATTALNRAMADLYTPTDAAKKAMEELGVSAYNTDGSARDVNDTIDDLAAALVGMSDEQANAYKNTIFTTQGLSAFNKMTSTSEDKINTFKEGLASASDGIGSAAEQAQTKLDNLQGQLTILSSAISEAAITVGEALTPAIKKVVSVIQNLTDRFNALDDDTKTLIVTIGAIVAAIAPVLLIVGKIITAVGTITGAIGVLMSSGMLPIIGIIAAIVAIGTLLYQNWDTIKEKATELYSHLAEKFEALKETVKEALDNIKDVVVNIFTAVKDTLSNIWDTICNVVQVGVMLIAEILNAAFQIITLPFQFIWINCQEYILAAWDAIKTTVSTALKAIKDSISQVWNGIVSFLNPILEGLKKTFSTIWSAISSTVSAAVNSVKSVVSSVLNIVKSTVATVLNSIKSTFSSVWDTIKSTVSNTVGTIKATISNGLQGALDTVSNILEKIKNKFSSIFDTAFNVVKNAIEKIKGAFNFSWSLPSLKLPHLSISGGFSISPPSVPKFSISWYKKAYDEAMILNSPSLFGYSEKTDRLLGGGDGNGNEVVSGEGHLISLIDGVVASRMDKMGDYLEKLTAIVQKGFPEIIDNMDKDVVLESGVLVGRLAPEMDRKLGIIAGHKGRGN